MDELHDHVDKLFTETDRLEFIIGDSDELSEQQVLLLLAAAKRVRRQSTLLVKHLASIRDQLHA